MWDLKGQTALVTGGAQGIGLGIVRELARAGSRVIIADINFQKASAAAQAMRRMGHDVIALALDVADDASVANCVKEAIERFSHVNILVNDAAINSEKIGRVSTIEQFERCFDVNLYGVWRMTQALVPHFKAQGGGRVINIVSIAARTPYPETPAYCASKAALLSVTRSLAMKLAEHNINVNGVCPGSVMTPMNEAFREDLPNMEEEQLRAQLIKRPVQPEDIGSAVVFFASSQARSITGQALNVDCGCYMVMN